MDSIRNITVNNNNISPIKPAKTEKADESKLLTGLDLYTKDFEDKNVTPNMVEKLGSAGRKTAGVTLGALMDSTYSMSGASTMIHESAHAAMVHAFFQNPTTEIQVDAFDNLKNFAKSPTGENFKHILSGYDVNQDKAAGITKIDPGDKLSIAGGIASLVSGGRAVPAVIAAAGCVAEEIPTFVGFAAGYKMRKQSPVMGYALMSLATIHHINTSMYPFSAMIPSIASTPGHDWTTFAKATGIPPVLTAVAFASTLPVLGYVMHRMEKKQETKMKNRWAAARLIQNGGISPNELKDAFSQYKDKNKIEKAQDRLASLMDTPITDLNGDTKKVTGELKHSIGNLKKEYDKFSDFLAEKFSGKVAEELKHQPPPIKKTFNETVQDMKAKYAESWKEDKVGTAIHTGTMAGSAGIALGIAGATAAGLAGAGGVASALASAVVPAIPVVGTLGAAGSIYNAAKTVRSSEAGLLDKSVSVGTALFSAVSAAGLLGFGAPFVLLGIAGVLGVQGAKTVIKAFQQ